jgi:hypothetical protein
VIMKASHNKTIGQVIDEILSAFETLDVNDRWIAMRAVSDRLKLSGPSLDNDNFVTPLATSRFTSMVDPSQIMDIRKLKEQKDPKSAIEMVCVVAYYLEALALPEERKQDITSSELEQYFKQAGYPLPKRKDQVLVDAKGAGYFDSAGRGRYRLNPVGHNLVVHTLPRSQK